MGIQVKICGIKTAEAADAAVQAGADYVGLNFIETSPRAVALDAAASLAERMRNRVRIVALVSNANDEKLASILRAVRPDMVQLHGSEAPDRVGAIRAQIGLPVMKAISIADASDFSVVAAYEAAADMLLFDAKPPSGATREGGNGIAFDWQLLRDRKFSRPWLLAGGLNAANVARAAQISQTPGVDTSSGVETAPGVKSADKIKEFILAARNAHTATEQRA